VNAALAELCVTVPGATHPVGNVGSSGPWRRLACARLRPRAAHGAASGASPSSVAIVQSKSPWARTASGFGHEPDTQLQLTLQAAGGRRASRSARECPHVFLMTSGYRAAIARVPPQRRFELVVGILRRTDPEPVYFNTVFALTPGDVRPLRQGYLVPLPSTPPRRSTAALLSACACSRTAPTPSPRRARERRGCQ
jgi:hypothetical protein